MKVLLKVGYFCWLAAIIVLSLIPQPPVPPSELLAWDKFQHAVAYGVLTLLGGLAFSFFSGAPAGRWLISLTLAVVVGGVMELAQAMFTATRTAEVGDLCADAIGGLFVAACGIILAVRRGGGSTPTDMGTKPRV